MVRLEGFSRGELNVVLIEAIEAIIRNGGWIKDRHAFSNKMATVAFEMHMKNVTYLIDELKFSVMNINIPPSESSLETGDEDVSLTISFVGEGSEMHRRVPVL